MVHSLAYIFFKLFCKLVEWLCRARTYAGRKSDDPTQVILDHYTDEQKTAELSIASLAATRLAEPTTVAVIIPFRDKWDLTQRAARQALAQASSRLRVQVYLLDNSSSEQVTRDGIAAMQDEFPGQVFSIACPFAFNFSKLMNEGARHADAGHATWLLLLNNDVEITKPGDVESMVAFAANAPNVGAVGCSLNYPDGRIQHLFVAPGVKIVAAHPLKGMRPGNWRWFAAPRPVAAVTGAALLVSTSVFRRVGGFDTELPTVGQDVDFCLKIQQRGLVNWVLPQVHWIHHEGASRGHAIDRQQVSLMYRKWGTFLTANPYYSSAFTRWSERPAFSVGEGAYPWRHVLL